MDFLLQELNTKKPPVNRPPTHTAANYSNNLNISTYNPGTHPHLSPQQPKMFPPKSNSNYRGSSPQTQYGTQRVNFQ